MLGGGQFDPFTWDQFFDTKEMICDGKIPLYTAGSGDGHVYLCLHGAGHSAQSFAVMAKILKENSTCVSFDFRGHGDNIQEDPLVMSVENLVADTISVI
jgi:protein phosphatase methylesterase 1